MQGGRTSWYLMGREANASLTVLADGQGNGGAEDIGGVILLLGPAQPLGMGPVALRHALRIARPQKVRIPAGKCRRVEGLAGGKRPLPMPLFLQLVSAMGK